ncbi:RES family NAD+ phosphorylase [Spirosoma sp. KNUC1025]|uniref:RES family NAD+ phosphorylase n=1 Tax=Spirosoma sp. KNUC1025 TaxID=2894082 RepID=UPI001E3E72D9|nr:RES family NAD+ phosphorylase [Spirosoma sp. KNUC1025]UFH57833.1 RES family NAD+ phosphorylase [Spirosoma sp. KNUC1025]
MPRVYRLIKERFLDTPLAGGSAKRGERWNPVGVDVLYTSSSPELALVEVLANLMPIRLDELPTYYLITIHLPNEQALKVYRVDQLPPDWNTPVRTTQLQTFLGEWLTGTRELAVALPSAVVPFSTNVILHRSHAAFEQVSVESIQPFTVDGRLVLPTNYGPLSEKS